MNPISTELKAMAARLRKLFPEAEQIELCASEGFVGIDLHRIGDYAAGTSIFRRLGIGDREKTPYYDENMGDWTSLVGEMEGLRLRVFCDGLPPSCRIETVTERIPKTATVDTGDFVDVQRRVVKCGGAA